MKATKSPASRKEPHYLLSEETRGRWMRHDTAYLLKRFYFCERALLLCQAAWLPVVPSLPVKLGLAQAIWENAQAADALRERVLELRYPTRMLEEEGADASLVGLYQNLLHAPSVASFLLCLAEILLPALGEAYASYLDLSDPIADAPSRRFLTIALRDKKQQIENAGRWSKEALNDGGNASFEARAWAQSMAEKLNAIGGIAVSETAGSFASEEMLPRSVQYSVPEKPARDPRFWPCRFYWPDNVDPKFPYGEGIALQLRAAISHLNEVWAVETGGIILSSFADALPWEWVKDAARWTYDEARHCNMGYNRLLSWGFKPSELPLGTYIYESVARQDPIYRLGMLFFFETKNIQKKQVRSRIFHSYGDAVSEHDMDFDWADETMHASYGKHWLKQILALGDRPGLTAEAVNRQCSQLVERVLETATPEEVQALKLHSDGLLAKASRIS